MARVGAVVLLSLVPLLVIFGPAWPEVAADLWCGDPLAVRATFESMDACALVLVSGCFCGLHSSWTTPLYYLGLVPVVLIGAVSMANRAIGRGMAAVAAFLWATPFLSGPVILAYGTVSRIPTSMQSVVVAWPQLVFFGPNLYRLRDGPVVPDQWASLVTLAFWAAVALSFGVLARRLKRVPVVLVLAALVVLATVLSVWWGVPLLGWRVWVEGP